VAYALLKRGVGRITLVDNDINRALCLRDRLSAAFGSAEIRTAGLAELSDVIRSADGLVNATPMGMAAHPGSAVPAELLRPDLWVADVVYRPLDTDLLEAARAIGARTLSGAGMAVYQAVDAFRIFTGIEPDADRMYDHMTALIHQEESVMAR
jgi:shikimate dehydrogenase